MATFPPSMPAGSHEMRNSFSNQDPPRLSPYSAPSITPYLGLRARLSQVWLNRWTILLLLVLARTLIAIAGINDNLGSARREALSACSSVESMGSAMASMPHYMSSGLNELTAKGVENSVQALQQMTLLSVTGVEEIVLFVINMFTQTYLCLITLAVTGSLQSVIGALDAASEALNVATTELSDGFADSVETFEKLYNAATGAITGVGGLGLGSISFPTLDLTSQIADIKNIKFPDSQIDTELKKLNQSIPTFAEVKNFTETLIRLPFEEVKELIQEHLGNYTFNRSTFAVPEKQVLSFCTDNDGINSFFDNMVKLSAKAKTTFLGVLLAAAILVCVPMAWREVKRHRKMQEHSQLIGTTSHDPMDVVYIVSRPYTAGAGIKVSRGYQTVRRQALIRWTIAYATSDAALFVLALGIAGLFSCLCQFVLLKSLEKEVPALSNQVGAFADKIVTSLNNASEQWAIDTNAVIVATNDDINQNMLGWVETSTTAVNDTLNGFVDETSKVLNATFGGTPLYDPIKDVLNCLVLLKVAGIQKALTWVHDNAHINFPLMPNDTFSIGAAASISSEEQDPSNSFLASPGDEASDKITAAVTRFINAFAEGIKTEVYISLCVLAIWIIVALIGVARALTLWFGQARVRGEGGPAADAFSSAAPIPMRGLDFRSDDQDRFVNVPLTGPIPARSHQNKSISEPRPSVSNNATRPYTPAPAYSEDRNPFTSNENTFDQKIGMGITSGDTNPFGDHNRMARPDESKRISLWESKAL